jgi:hypothetical protein
MSHIDIARAFRTAAPEIDLRAVRMTYLQGPDLHELEFDVCGPNGEKYTHSTTVPAQKGVAGVMMAARTMALSLQNKPQPVSTPAKTTYSLFGDARIVEDSPLEPIGNPGPVKLTGLDIGLTKLQEMGQEFDADNVTFKAVDPDAKPTHVFVDGQTYELTVDGRPNALLYTNPKQGAGMSKNAVNRVSTAVGGAVDKIEKAADRLSEELNQLSDTIETKFDSVRQRVISPTMDALSQLDDILFGDNGGPALDDATFPATIRDAAGQPIVESRPGAATAAAPEASKLGAPTGGITASDVSK